MRRPALRWALLVPVLLALLVGIIGLGVYVERSVRSDLVASIDDELNRAAGRDLGRGGPGTPPPPPQAALDEAATPSDDDPGADLAERLDGATTPTELRLSADGSVESLTRTASPFGDALAATWFDERGTFTANNPADGINYRVLAVQGREGSTEVVALPLASVDESIASLRRNLLLGGVGLFVLQSLVVWLISGRVSRPVTRMSQVAQRIAEGELDTDIGEPRGTAETAALADDLGRMVDRLRGTIEDRESAALAAQEAQRDMQRFLADASHELRTPLTALRGYSDLHANGMLAAGEPLDRAMKRIGSESERLHRLVVDMLQVVREPSVAEPVAGAEVLDGVAADLEAAFPERTVRVVEHDEAVVLGDSGRLHQAVLNLGANACAHTPAGTPIELRVVRTRLTAQIQVIDHGPGIAADEAEAIFRPFTRGDASRSRRDHDGAGLGLAIVASVVEEHAGTVTISETPGGGATFIIELPLIGARQRPKL